MPGALIVELIRLLLALAAAALGAAVLGRDPRTALPNLDDLLTLLSQAADSPLRAVAGPAQVLWDLLTQPEAPSAGELANAATRTAEALRDNRQALEAAAPTAVPVAPPQAVLAARDLQAVRTLLARMAVWRQAHSGDVHRDAARAEVRLAGAAAELAAAAGALAEELPRAVDLVAGWALPRAVDLVLDRLHDLRSDVRARDAELADAIDEVAREVRRDILGLRELLTDQVVPDILGRLHEETQARREADRRIAQEVVPEAVAPALRDAAAALAWTAAVGVAAPTVGLAASKVTAAEPLFDLLLSQGLDLLGLLAVGPGLAALVGLILDRTAPHIPGVLAGFAAGVTRLVEAA